MEQRRHRARTRGRPPRLRCWSGWGGQPGEGQDGATFAALQDELAGRTRACTYDRAGIGQSQPGAPTPRTYDDVVDDLQTPLDEVGVDGPHVLVGASAGANFSLHHARRHPDEVVGVLAMNPVPPASAWVERAYPLLTATEAAYYGGENGESIDYTASDERHQALAAPDEVVGVLAMSPVPSTSTRPSAKATSRDPAGRRPTSTCSSARGTRPPGPAHDIHADRDLALGDIDELLAP